MIKEKTTTVYVTDDGREFTDKMEAVKHENGLKNLRFFTVYAYPDLTEGRHGPKPQGVLIVNAMGYHELFAKHWCYEMYGNSVEFVMGTVGSNAVTDNWYLIQANVENLDKNTKYIGYIKEKFVNDIDLSLFGLSDPAVGIMKY